MLPKESPKMFALTRNHVSGPVAASEGRGVLHSILNMIVISVIVAAPAGATHAAAENAMTPLQRAASTPRGTLKSPYSDFANVAAEGHKIFLSHDCSSCHGGGGGGGMAAPLTNEVWIYGDDDDILFRVIALGTGSLSPEDAFRRQGFVRKGSENVVGPMPPFGDIFKTDDEIWKLIAWIRSVQCERRPSGC
jgi:mono/diheme cytochrome c family protein